MLDFRGIAHARGSLSADRYLIDCPRCHRPAHVSSDTLGRTIVSCSCDVAPFPMPLVRGTNSKEYRAIEWRVDLSPAAISEIDPMPQPPEPPPPPKQRAPYGSRPVKGKKCATADCQSACGPKARYCNRCSRALSALSYQCSEPGCTNMRQRRRKRCDSCETENQRKRNRNQRGKAFFSRKRGASAA